MSTERPTIITDSGSSIHPNSPEAKNLHVGIAPFDLSFYENGQWVSVPDSDLTPAQFYSRMKNSSKLPKTSGAITSKLVPLYESHSPSGPIISIHVTSEHSVAYFTALQAMSETKSKYPEMTIAVIDSRQISLGVWFLVEQAAQMAQSGENLESIKKATLETIPKIKLITALDNLENAVKGGRIPSLAGHLGSLFQIKPIVDLINGKLTITEKTRTTSKARQALINRVANSNQEIVKMAVIHTNDPEGAETVRQSLSQFYHLPIPIYEAGPIIGIHAGEKAISVAFQNK